MHDGWAVCAEAQDGLEAVEKAKELRPSIIILDLAMPSMNGLSAAREIRMILPSTPVVLYTLHTAEVLDFEAKKVGIRRVVSKPNTAELVCAMEEILKQEMRDGVQERSMSAAASVTSPPGTSPLHKPK